MVADGARAAGSVVIADDDETERARIALIKAALGMLAGPPGVADHAHGDVEVRVAMDVLDLHLRMSDVARLCADGFVIDTAHAVSDGTGTPSVPLEQQQDVWRALPPEPASEDPAWLLDEARREEAICFGEHRLTIVLPPLGERPGRDAHESQGHVDWQWAEGHSLLIMLGHHADGVAYWGLRRPAPGATCIQIMGRPAMVQRAGVDGLFAHVFGTLDGCTELFVTVRGGSGTAREGLLVALRSLQWTPLGPATG